MLSECYRYSSNTWALVPTEDPSGRTGEIRMPQGCGNKRLSAPRAPHSAKRASRTPPRNGPLGVKNSSNNYRNNLTAKTENPANDPLEVVEHYREQSCVTRPPFALTHRGRYMGQWWINILTVQVASCYAIYAQLGPSSTNTRVLRTQINSTERLSLLSIQSALAVWRQAAMGAHHV